MDDGYDRIDVNVPFRTKAVFIVSKGECKKLGNGDFTLTQQEIDDSVLIKGVPLSEFDSAKAHWRSGGIDNARPVRGFEETSSTVGANLALDSGQPKTISIDADISSVKLNIAWESMYYIKDNGGLAGSTTGFNIHTKVAGGTWELYEQRKQHMRSTTPFAQTYEVNKPFSNGTWQIRITRLGPITENKTATSLSSNETVTHNYTETTFPEHGSTVGRKNESGHFNTFKLDSYIEVKQSNALYPNDCYFAIEINSESVNDLLRDITFTGYGRLCHIPNLDGSVGLAYSNCPAHVLFDIMYADDSFGLALADKNNQIDIAQFHRAHQWCVAQSFFFGAQISKQSPPPLLTASIAASFLGKLVKTSSGKISVTWPQENTSSSFTLSNSDVIEGVFDWTTGNINSQVSQVIGRFQNFDENGETVSVIESDNAGIADRGLIVQQLELIGVQNEQHARTLTKYQLAVNSSDTKTVEWLGPFSHALYNVSDVINIDDQHTGVYAQVKIIDISLTDSEKGYYKFLAVEFNPLLYSVATGNSTNPFVYLPNPDYIRKRVISAPRNLIAREIFDNENPDLSTGQILVSWETPNTGIGFIKHYRVETRYENGLLDHAKITGTSYTITNAQAGDYSIRVIAYGISGNRSPTASINYRIQGDDVISAAVNAPTSLKIPNTSGSGETIFDGPDLRIRFDDPADIGQLRRYEVEFYSNNNILMKNHHIQKQYNINHENEAVLTYTENRAASNANIGITGVQRTVKIKVYAISVDGRKSSVLQRTFNNPQIPATSIQSIETGSHHLNCQINEVNDIDLDLYVAYASDNPNNLTPTPDATTLVYKGKSNVFQMPVEPNGQRMYVRVGAVDTFWNGTVGDVNLSGVDSGLSKQYKTSPDWTSDLVFSISGVDNVAHTAGTIRRINLDGSVTEKSIPAKTYSFSAGQKLYIKHVFGNSHTFSSSDYSQSDTTVVLCCWDGSTLTQTDGRKPLQDGSTFIMYSGAANFFDANTIHVRNGNIENLSVDTLKMQGDSVTLTNVYESLATRWFYPNEGWTNPNNSFSTMYPPDYYYVVPNDNQPFVKINAEFQMNITLVRKSSGSVVERTSFDPIYLEYNDGTGWQHGGPIAVIPCTNKDSGSNLVQCLGSKTYEFPPNTNVTFRLVRNSFLTMIHNLNNTHYDYAKCDRPRLTITTLRR